MLCMSAAPSIELCYHLLQIELALGLDVDFTACDDLSPKERRAVLGNSFSVPVIAHLLTSLVEVFKFDNSSSTAP